MPTEVLALGDSQAAFGLTTYVNGVQPLTRAFDGFFVMSRAGSAMVVPSGARAARVGATILGPPTTFRTDTDVPIFDLQTESDVAGILGSFRRAAAGHGPRSGSGRPPGPRTPTSTSSAIGPPTRSTAGR